MNRRSFCKKLLAGGSLVVAGPGVSHALSYGAPTRYREMRYVMGTLLDITVYDRDPERVRKFFDEAFHLVEQLDSQLSNYKLDSDISRLNSLDSGKHLRVSGDTYAVLRAGQDFAKRTAGRFDITVRPLLDLWQDSARKQLVPKTALLEKHKRACGPEHIELLGDNNIGLRSPLSGIDTGGIGKGYAVDKIVSLFPRFDIRSALINFGTSTIYAHGTPPGEQAWRIGLHFPNESPRGVLTLRDTAASASASFGESVLIAGTRFGHLIDPRSGEPLRHKRLAAVTTRSALEAEVFSSDVVIQGSLFYDGLNPNVAVESYLESQSEVLVSESFPLVASS